MSRDLGREVPDLEKLYARKLWADFSYPKKDTISCRTNALSCSKVRLSRGTLQKSAGICRRVSGLENQEQRHTHAFTRVIPGRGKKSFLLVVVSAETST